MEELRWTLLILGALFIGGLALWEWRRQRHARGADGAGQAPFAAGSAHEGERVSPTFDGGAGAGERMPPAFESGMSAGERMPSAFEGGMSAGQRIAPTFDGGADRRGGERISPTFEGAGDVPFAGGAASPARGVFREPTLTFPEVSVEIPVDSRDRFADPPVVELDDASLDRLKVEAGEAVDEFSEPRESGDAVDDFSEDLDAPSPAEPMVPRLSPAAVAPTLSPAHEFAADGRGDARSHEWQASLDARDGEAQGSPDPHSSEPHGLPDMQRWPSQGSREAFRRSEPYIAAESHEAAAGADERGRHEGGAYRRGPDVHRAEAGSANDAPRRRGESPGAREPLDPHDEPTARFEVSAPRVEGEASDPARASAAAAPGADAFQPVEPIVEWPGEDTRKIVALRLVSGSGERFAGRAVRLALAAEGFVLGKFDIFHKPGPDARAVLSAASLTKPGTFSLSTMDAQRFGGLSLFAVLPGPLSPLATFDELVVTARALNDRLRGALQDERGEPLTPVRSANIRESLTAAATAAAPVVGAAAAPPVVGSPGDASSV